MTCRVHNSGVTVHTLTTGFIPLAVILVFWWLNARAAPSGATSNCKLCRRAVRYCGKTTDLFKDKKKDEKENTESQQRRKEKEEEG